MIKFLVIFLLIFVTRGERPTFQCAFSTGGFGKVGTIYYCTITSGPSITEFPTEDVLFTKTHSAGKTDNDVKAIYCHSLFYSNKISYFPRGIEKTFKNLLIIAIQSVQLKEIHKEDLQPFNNLQEIYLDGNNIEVLEEGLFDANRNLQGVYLQSNKIKFIHETVFNNLDNLKSLQLFSNTCISESASENPTALKVIQNAKTKCTNDVDSYKRHLKKSPYDRLWKKMTDEEKEQLKSNVQKLTRKVQEIENQMTILQNQIKVCHDQHRSEQDQSNDSHRY